MEEDVGRGSPLIWSEQKLRQYILWILLWCGELGLCSFLSSWSAAPETGCPALPISLPLVYRHGQFFLMRFAVQVSCVVRSGLHGKHLKKHFPHFVRIFEVWSVSYAVSVRTTFSQLLVKRKNWNILSEHIFVMETFFVLPFWLMTSKFTLFLLAWIKYKFHKIILTKVNRC